MHCGCHWHQAITQIPVFHTCENTSKSCASVTSRSRSPTYRLELWEAALPGAGAGAAASAKGAKQQSNYDTPKQPFALAFNHHVKLNSATMRQEARALQDYAATCLPAGAAGAAPVAASTGVATVGADMLLFSLQQTFCIHSCQNCESQDCCERTHSSGGGPTLVLTPSLQSCQALARSTRACVRKLGALLSYVIAMA
jgi:hypothetical protein